MKVRLISLFVLSIAILTACIPTSSPPATTTSAGAANSPQRGGTVTMAMWQSPTTLNYYLGGQGVVFEVITFVNEGLTHVLPDGTREALLAKELPTPQNGGVSADGKTITYKLKDGVTFSDGAPLTCDDVKFTWQAIMTPGVGVVYTTGYSEIDSIDCPDPQSVVIRFKNFYSPYLTLFDKAILPKSAGDPKEMKNWAYNRKPIGTGPFKVDEWVADDHITLSRNEKYREPGKPYLDQVIIRIVPSSDVALQLLKSGEIDIMWNNTEADLPQLQKAQGVVIASRPRMGGERMVLNPAENKDPSDPSKPHLILGDVRVRQAIAYGLDRQKVIDNLLSGEAKLGTSDVNNGFFNCITVQPYPFDPDKAKKLLEEAGWLPGSDGIRVAKGAKYAPDGTRLRLKFMTTSGNKLREDSQVIWTANMRDIGVEFFIENGPSSVVLGTWDSGAPYKHGNFDIMMYSSLADIDPHLQMVSLFASRNIASEKNKNGTNISRFSDPKVDDLLSQAAVEQDMAKRKALYCQVADIVHDNASTIYLYQRSNIHSYRERVLGPVAGNAWSYVGWDAADWWVKPSN